jgi:hypothetical protein
MSFEFPKAQTEYQVCKKYLTPNKEYFDKIFNLVYNAAMDQDGDGSAKIYCNNYNYLEVAKLFEHYLSVYSALNKWVQVKDDDFGFINFHLDNKSICIMQLSKIGKLRLDYDDIAIII